MTTGQTSRVISSTSWLSNSQRTRLPLPCTCSSPAGLAFSSPMAEQEGVGALVDLVDEHRGLVVEQRRGPSAALESAPAVLIPRAESPHHSIDGGVRDGRQLPAAPRAGSV